MLSLTVEDSTVTDAEVETGTIQWHRAHMTLAQSITHTESTSLSLREAEFAPGINSEETTVLWALTKQWLPQDTKCYLCL